MDKVKFLTGQEIARLVGCEDVYLEAKQKAETEGSSEDDSFCDMDRLLEEMRFKFMLSCKCGLQNEDEETLVAVVDVFNDNGIPDKDSFHNFCKSYYPNGENGKGFCLNTPIVINTTEDYVHLEYCIADAIINYRYHPFNIDFEMQSLIKQEERKIDCLTFKVTDNPDSTKSHIEEFYFDITAGYDALSKLF